MDDLISRQAAIEAVRKIGGALASITTDGHETILIDKAAVQTELMLLPTIDAVPVGAYEQTRWERDTAIAQLEEIGKSLCEKMDDVARVKHGTWTKHTLPDCTYFICSLCGLESIDSKSIYDDDGWYVDEVGMTYCPNCGAKMERSEE